MNLYSFVRADGLTSKLFRIRIRIVTFHASLVNDIASTGIYHASIVAYLASI